MIPGFYLVVNVLCAIKGVICLAFTALMWFGAVLITPLGFLFGLGEMSCHDAR
jgi:hypothetical protein